MNTNILKKVIGFEIEATTRCNAGCPGCPRYDYDELDKLNSCVTPVSYTHLTLPTKA